jgi:hypothetical protein
LIAVHPAMPRDGAIIFSDLTGKLDVLRVNCEKCGRDGCYGLSRLINQRGGGFGDANMKWLSASRLALAQQ